jgi:hypothetical protein
MIAKLSLETRKIIFATQIMKIFCRGEPPGSPLRVELNGKKLSICSIRVYTGGLKKNMNF